MPLLPNKAESWRETLKFINRCPICTESYDPKEAKLFGKQDIATLIHITCGKCSSHFVAMIMLVGQGVSSVGMITDLTFADVQKLYRLDPLTMDEIIDGHESIFNQSFIHSLLLNR